MKDNIKVVIDSGHGGNDPGASANGIIEKDLTLSISKELESELEKLGIPVYLTRTTDETLTPAERTRRILNAYGNRDDVVVISNHINAGGGDGAEVIYALRNNSTLSNLILDEIQKEGQNVRKAYQRRLPSNTSKDYYFIHRDTGITEPVIIEYGFLDSSLDDVEQLKTDYSAYARAVARAIAQYSGIEFSSDGVYTVKAGDSLWSIAKKLNVSVEELKNANNLNNNLLRIGQILKIPEVEESTEYKVYTVKAGDNLYSIARENNTTVNDLLTYNNLSTNSLNVGQQLLIPTTMLDESDSNYLTYTVRNGDSLYRIANTYDVTIDEIIALNNLNTTLLSVGQVLRIPFNNMSDNLSSSNYIEYIVKAGDSLYKISNQYDTTINELLTYNNLNNNNLSIGQVLKIPIEVSSQKYIVQRGDTLYSLSRKFNVPIQTIRTRNNLTNDNLSLGQILII